MKRAFKNIDKQESDYLKRVPCVTVKTNNYKQMKKRFIPTILLCILFGTAFGQFQIPLYASGNNAGLSVSNDYSLLSVTGQNAIGLTSDANNKIFLGLLAPVKYVLTDASITSFGLTQLFQNFPNPYKTQTTIPFEISIQAKVKLTVFNILGQPIAQLVDEELPPGKHFISFDSKKVKPGLFLYQLEVGNFRALKTMVLTK